MKNISTTLLSGGVVLLMHAVPAAHAANDEALPQQQMIAAIQTAVAALP